jgi:hypothetical protein
MKNFLLGVFLLLLCGCAGPKRGAAFMDAFEGVRVVQMSGNNISSSPMQRSLLCLNARRETRLVNSITNQLVTWLTNRSISSFTNVSSTSATNSTAILITNQLPLVASERVATNSDAPLALTAPTPDPTTNSTVNRTADGSRTVSSGNNQLVTALNAQTNYAFNKQISGTSSNLAITTVENEAVRTETNHTITVVTNITVVPVTNTVVLNTNLLLHQHFLFTEFTPPPDFTLASGESLILLVDGVRHAFAATNSSAVLPERRGFLTTLYKVPPQTLVDIANAREVRIRFRGLYRTIERTMNERSRDNFKKFLLKYYTVEAMNAETLIQRSLSDAPDGLLSSLSSHCVTPKPSVPPHE